MSYFNDLARMHFSNDRALYEETTEGAAAAVIEHWGNVSDAAFDFGYVIENAISNSVVKKLSIIPEAENLIKDLMSAAIREIDYYAIAREFVEQAAEELKKAGKLTPWNY